MADWSLTEGIIMMLYAGIGIMALCALVGIVCLISKACKAIANFVSQIDLPRVQMPSGKKKSLFSSSRSKPSEKEIQWFRDHLKG